MSKTHKTIQGLVATLSLPVLLSSAGIKAQEPVTDLPRGFLAAVDDSGAGNTAATKIMITPDLKYYVGKDLTAEDDLNTKIGDAIKRNSNQAVYLLVTGAADYHLVVNLLKIIRDHGVGNIGLVVDRKSSGESQIGIFHIFVPITRVDDKDISALKPNPLTLVAALDDDLELTLNHDRAGRRGQLCFEAAPTGLDADPSRLKDWLICIFRFRTQQRAYRIGMETRTEIPLEQRIEKTVFVKAPVSVKYVDVLRVINAVSAAGAEPIGLQIDDLPR